VDPGISYSGGPHSISFHVRIGYFYKRHANPYTGNPGDATLPKHVFLTSYAVRLGRSARPPTTNQPNGPATPPSSPVVPQAAARVEVSEGVSLPASSSPARAFCR
jgi:hypothetical protein